MGFLDSVGAGGFFSGFSSSAAVLWIGIGVLAFAILVFAGGITFWYYMKKAKKKAFKNQVPIFKEINGKRTRIGLDWAKELYVPDSNISLYFLKTHKIYLARPTRFMGKDESWYSIADNGEWINFDLSVNPNKSTMADINFDHRDTRYAYVNLKEIIKKNYKEKAVVWWKDPVVMNIITFVIMSIIFIGFCWFVISRMGNLIAIQGDWLTKMDIITEKLSGAVVNAQNINSGVVSV